MLLAYREIVYGIPRFQIKHHVDFNIIYNLNRNLFFFFLFFQFEKDLMRRYEINRKRAFLNWIFNGIMNHDGLFKF